MADCLDYLAPLCIHGSMGSGALRNPNRCVYCGQMLSVHRGQAFHDILRRVIQVGECSCGWWYTVISNDLCNDGHEAAIAGVLQSFGVTDAKLPIEALRSELPARPELLNKINPVVLEKLVAAVLEGVFNCEVQHVGKSHDGGVDLVLLDSDAPIAVQVKRRSKPKSTESVTEVRAFLGATLLKSFRRCLFVSTADHFSGEATKAAETSTRLGLVSQFDLIDVNALRRFESQTASNRLSNYIRGMGYFFSPESRKRDGYGPTSLPQLLQGHLFEDIIWSGKSPYATVLP